MQAVIWILAVIWPPAVGVAVWCGVGHVAGILATLVAYLVTPFAVIAASIDLPNHQGLRRALPPLYMLVFQAAPTLVVVWFAGLFNY